MTGLINAVYSLSSRSSDSLIKGELGLYPIYIDAMARIQGYFLHINSIDASPLVQTAVRVQEELAESQDYCWWNNCLRLMEEAAVYAGSWTRTEKQTVRERLQKKFKNQWVEKITDPAASRYGDYAQFKVRFGAESYLKDTSGFTRINILKYRIGDFHIRDDATCPFCNQSTPPGPIHFMSCQYFQPQQVQYNVPQEQIKILININNPPVNMYSYMAAVTKETYLHFGKRGRPRTRAASSNKINPIIT